MQNSGEFSVQRKGKQSLFPAFQINFLLRCRYKRCKDFSRPGRPAHQQMPQISLMGIAMIKGRLFLFKITKCLPQDRTVIVVHKTTAIHRYDIIKAAFFMHAQRQRSILYLVSERKFHLIAVSVINGALTDRLDLTDALLFGKHRLQQLPDLVFLYLQAFFIWHGNIAASAADIKMRATAVFNTDSFYRRFFQNFL